MTKNKVSFQLTDAKFPLRICHAKVFLFKGYVFALSYSI